MKTWQDRIETKADPLFESFTSSVTQDLRLAPYDIKASRAHALALVHAGLLTEEDGDILRGGLDQVASEFEGGTFAWRDDLEDVHTHVESRLRDTVGAAADALHAGRSRNDQVAADLRMYVRERTVECLIALLDVQDALLELSTCYRSAVMPGYTHLQQAQPILLAQWMLAYISMLGRDWERFHDGLPRTNLSPLGSGALAGSNFPLDRDLLALECGFQGIVANSLDAVSDRDFLVEFVGAAALSMTHLSRLSEDLILWSSTEFGFVRLPDAFSSGSSMMPQKKNPDILELIRGKCALVLGDSAAVLALVKGLPLGYNRDLQEDKVPLYHAAETLLSSLRVLKAMIPKLEFETDRMEASVSSFSMATDLADQLVQQGVPFRQAHGIIARLVSTSLKEGANLKVSTSSELAGLSAPSARTSVESKETTGSTAPDQVKKQLAACRVTISQRRTWLEETS